MDDALATELMALRADGKLDVLATRAVTAYRDELEAFLVNVMGSLDVAQEVLSQTIEDLWRGLPKFEARCSIRTWMYVLAQHAAARYRRSPWVRGDRSGDAKLDELVAQARSQTSPWQRTDVKDKWRQLRDELDPDDRALLVLRVDRGLDWSEVARVMAEDGESCDAETVTKESAKLRKRFQVLKDRLRERAIEVGLVGDER